MVESAVVGNKGVLRAQLIDGFKRDKFIIFCFSLLLVYLLASLFAPVIAPFNPYDLSQVDILDAELPPLWEEGGDPRFLLGTDAQGRDMFSTILYGTRISLLIGVGAVLLQTLLGVAIGLTAGYFGGKVDSLLMRIADIQLSFSTLMVAIIAAAVFRAAFGEELYGELAVVILILVIGTVEWPQFARTVRASVLAEKQKEYVEAARVMGFGSSRIMWRHILPNTLSPLLVIFTLQIANAIIAEASLSFLGLGMPVSEPSLGALISSGFEYIFSESWWIAVIPGVVLVLLILVINLLGDWLRDMLNPKFYRM
ncbi:ABC transporter permease [Motiliproteus sp. MSK22-1]|uniref:ABC transporter permease n=1 Tax=Motiliproteus sp. MSK22-1 TaxID=1897630 RepID=UPI000976E801|nr:ABC transporter permease [Motiliproteus sp. MSK22-1]OMH38368.1 ABC transporter permease [Motiliproteus sp. MSK22-1]